jgi:hypothetical protein
VCFVYVKECDILYTYISYLGRGGEGEGLEAGADVLLLEELLTIVLLPDKRRQTTKRVKHTKTQTNKESNTHKADRKGQTPTKNIR